MAPAREQGQTDRAGGPSPGGTVRIAMACIPSPSAALAIDGIRAALDPSRVRIPVHCTVAPPVATRDLATAEAFLRALAALVDPIDVVLGPVASFAPVSPTRYIEVSDRAGALAIVEQASRASGPFARPRQHDYVPHITIQADTGGDAVDPDPVVGAMAHFRRLTTFRRLTLLQARPGREGPMWTPVADADFGGPAVVGRGGIEVELTSGTIDPAALGSADDILDDVDAPRPLTTSDAVVVTARAAGAVVGVARGEVHGPFGRLASCWVSAEHHAWGTFDHLVARWSLVAARRGAVELHGSPELTDALEPLGWLTGGGPVRQVSPYLGRDQ